MPSDPLTDSVRTRVHIEGEEEFVIWVKRYKSGRTRVQLPVGYEMTGMVNNHRVTDGLFLELMPKKEKK